MGSCVLLWNLQNTFLGGPKKYKQAAGKFIGWRHEILQNDSREGNKYIKRGLDKKINVTMSRDLIAERI